MPYIGQAPTSTAFLTDTFSGTGSITAFTMSVAPATPNAVLVAVSGVLQDPSTYSVSGTTLTFSAAPPSGTGNISARYLGIPASGVTTTAYRTITEFTATAGQTTFTPPSYTVGFIQVYRNGVLLGSADYTATNGTTVVLTTGATAGDLITTISFYVSSVLNAIPATAGAVNSTYIANGAVGSPQLNQSQILSAIQQPTGSIVQVVSNSLTTGFSINTNGGSGNITGLYATITPQFSTSKIMIMMSIMYGTQGGNSTTYGGYFTRNGTKIGAGTSTNGTAQQVGFTLSSSSTADTNQTGYVTYQYLDSPISTSALTYQVVVCNDNSETLYVNNSAANLSSITGKLGISTVTLMEIR